ncbi:MAG: tRNA preQ1(34) S-adenosylmethionine ribosyltransferase-isomerase QueA [Candidatus Woesearchaeota archaeon]
MRIDDYRYELPKDMIAQKPAVPRDSSKLLVLYKKTGKIEHTLFRDIVNYLKPEDTIVINSTKVIPAKIEGKKETGGKVTFLMTRKISEKEYEGFLKGRVKDGTRIYVKSNDYCVVKKGEFARVRFSKPLRLGVSGTTPLPPYIKTPAKLAFYQTVYAKKEGSVAAPTAGLHFTRKLLKKIKAMGVGIASITLHVGPGTFLPFKDSNIGMNRLHKEYYEIDQKNAAIINNTKGRLFVVGTTSLRALESAAHKNGIIQPKKGWTDLFIYPGYRFKIKLSGGLITNFHLPFTTLLVLVSAIAGREKIITAYEEAKKRGYRFYSFGDAMLILS